MNQQLAAEIEELWGQVKALRAANAGLDERLKQANQRIRFMEDYIRNRVPPLNLADVLAFGLNAGFRPQ